MTASLSLGLAACAGSGSPPTASVAAGDAGNQSTGAAAVMPADATGEMLVGVAVEDITPTWPTWLSSTVSKWVSDHYSDLEVKAMVISDKSAPVVIVTADIIGFCAEISEPIYDRVKAFGFQPHQIVLNASHAHSVPAVCDVYDVLDAAIYPIARYQAFFIDRIVSAVKRAKENMKPAVLSISEAESDICVNRDGPPHPPGGIIPHPDGIIDRRVRLLQVRDPGSEIPRAILTVFGCHPADVWPKDGVGSFGSEFLGFGREYVEGLYPGTVVLTAQGTGGDVMLAHYENDDINQGFGGSYVPDIAPNKEFGRRFGTAIVQALHNESTPVRGRIRAGMSTVKLPVEEPPSRDFVERVAKGEAAPDDYQRLKRSPWYRRWGEWMAARYEQGIPFTDSVGPYDIRVIHIGNDLTLVALNGEVQTCIGQKTEMRLDSRPTFVLGFSNNTTAYIPCAENFAPPQNGGNWEIPIYYWWLWQTAQFRPSVDTVIVDETEALARRLLRQ